MLIAIKDIKYPDPKTVSIWSTTEATYVYEVDGKRVEQKVYLNSAAIAKDLIVLKLKQEYGVPEELMDELAEAYAACNDYYKACEEDC